MGSPTEGRDERDPVLDFEAVARELNAALDRRATPAVPAEPTQNFRNQAAQLLAWDPARTEQK